MSAKGKHWMHGFSRQDPIDFAVICFFFSSQYIAKQLLSLISQIYPEFTMQSLLLAIGNDLFSQFWPSFQKAECQIITVYLVFCCQKI